jgi:hypothetical protein
VHQKPPWSKWNESDGVSYKFGGMNRGSWLTEGSPEFRDDRVDLSKAKAKWQNQTTRTWMSA